MGLIEQKINKIIKESKNNEVFCFYSTVDYLLQQASSLAINAMLKNEDAQVTKIEGPMPDVSEIIAATGTISFFKTKRIVELYCVEPSAVPQKDLDDLCNVMDSLENACIVLTCLFKDDKASGTKKAKQLLAAAQKHGLAVELIKPTDRELQDIAVNTAQNLGAVLSAKCAKELVERCKDDAALIENETAKLSAIANYGEISLDMVQRASTLNIEADVFDMIRLISAKNKPKVIEKLSALLLLQSEPVAVCAALSGSFVDVYRMKCADEKRVSYTALHKMFAYTGSDYRLKKAGETAANYSKKQLKAIIEVLLQLDVKLKSSIVDKTLLLQTAICEILEIGDRK